MLHKIMDQNNNSSYTIFVFFIIVVILALLNQYFKLFKLFRYVKFEQIFILSLCHNIITLYSSVFIFIFDK